MKLASLFSGGKDSTLALIKASQTHNITCVISLIPKNPESYMFHSINSHLTKYQAEAMNIEIVQEFSSGEKDKELEDLKRVIENVKKDFGIEGIVSGAIESDYQASRIKKICDELNLKLINPNWHLDYNTLMNEIEKFKIKAIITQIASYPLNKDYLGKTFNREIFEEFKKLKVHPFGEGGEFETFVIDAINFKKKIEIENFEIISENENFAFMKINSIKLIEKNAE